MAFTYHRNDPPIMVARDLDRFLVVEAPGGRTIHVDIVIDGNPQRVECTSFALVGWGLTPAPVPVPEFAEETPDAPR